eukprot:m.5617 g.5617  ORF g.5617 m.5617 type:complete len:618 (-) comp3341_c0_seq1:31-1884(-)
MSYPQMTLWATSSWRPLPIVTAIALDTTGDEFVYTSRRLGNTISCTQPLGPSCKKTPCKPCTVCEGVSSFAGSSCETLSLPTTVIKREYVAKRRSYTLGSVTFSLSGTKDMYSAGLGENTQTGAFLSGNLSVRDGRLVFGSSGSINCSSPSFQRNVFFGTQSTLVRGAMAVTRSVSAKVNGCESTEPHCDLNAFPLWLYVPSRIYETRRHIQSVTTNWICMDGGAAYACIGLSGKENLTESPQCIGGDSPAAKSGQQFWNGTLLLFNGSAPSKSVGVLQMADPQDFDGFEAFVAHMKSAVIQTDSAGNVEYIALSGEKLSMQEGGIVQVPRLQKSYDSPYISALYGDTMTVQLRVPGYETENITFSTLKESATPSVLWEANFSQPLRMETEANLANSNFTKRIRMPNATTEWVLESEQSAGRAVVVDGKLQLQNHGGHLVFWCNKQFPSDFILRFGMEPQSTQYGLNIVFFSAAPIGGSFDNNIFSLELPLRNGVYANYTRGAIQTYSISYFRVNPDGSCTKNPQGLCEANLRKDPGFHLVQEGIDLIGNKKNQLFHVEISQIKGNITVTVNGKTEASWVDPGSGPMGSVLGPGYIGLRQMNQTISTNYSYFEILTP